VTHIGLGTGKIPEPSPPFSLVQISSPKAALPLAGPHANVTNEPGDAPPVIGYLDAKGDRHVRN